MYRVQPQAVEAIVAQPVNRILDGEGAYFGHPIIDRAAPGRLRLREEIGGITREVIPFRAEVIVDDVEKDHQAAQMSFIDQRLEVFRASIGAVWRIPQYAII